MSEEIKDVSPRDGGRKLGALLVALLLLIGLGVRVFSAWAYSYEPCSDYTRVALMAKHMAEGTDYPAFFYGSNYMGSFEPAVSALICFLFGTSGFAVCLGTALVAFLVLPFVYFWGRDAGGRIAGLVALAFCIVGPFDYFYYMASPRGGYAVVLAAGTFILWWSGRIALDEFARKYVAPWRYAWLGLVGGLAWWSNQLVTSALFTAAIVLAVSLRLRVFKARVFLAGSLFALGCMPWWLWNIFHQWSSMDFRNAVGYTPWGVGCKLLGEIMLGLVEIFPPYGAVDILSFAVYLSAILLGILFVLRKPSGERPGGYRVHLGMALLFIGISSLVFCRSLFAYFHTARYLLPLLPAFAVLLGSATAWLSVRLKYGLALIPVAVLIASHVDVLPRVAGTPEADRIKWATASTLADFCRDRKIDVVYGSIWEHWINFASDERCCFCFIGGEPYAPYEKRGETAQNCAVIRSILNDEPSTRFYRFIRHTAASAAFTNISPLKLDYNAQPPGTGWCVLDPARVRTVLDRNGSNICDLVFDEDAGTAWKFQADGGETGRVEVVFKQPQTIAGIRLLARGELYPKQVAVQGRMADGEWRDLVERTEGTWYFWSGPRFFWRGVFYRSEFRFKPVQIDALRVDVHVHGPGREVALEELQIFEAESPTKMPGGDDVVALIDRLTAGGKVVLYADRWESIRVYEQAGDRIATVLSPFMGRTVNDGVRPDTPCLAAVDKLSAITAFLAPVQEAGVTRRTLARRHVAMRETETGPWVLFDFAPGMWKPVYGDIPFDCTWTGTSLMTGTGTLSEKREAVWLYALAGDKYRANPQDPETVALLEQAVEAYPAFALPHRELISVLSGSGRTEDAARYTAAHKALTMPEIYAPVAFTNGVQLLGICPAVDGRRVTLEWRWTCPPGLNVSNLVTFVHFIGEAKDQVFQDDHPFMWGVPPESLRFQPLEEVFSVVREFTIPDNAPPGRYRVIAGLYNPSTGLRVKPVTRLQVEGDAVEIPFAIEVQ